MRDRIRFPDIFFILFFLFLTFFAWRRLPELIMASEAFTYLIKRILLIHGAGAILLPGYSSSAIVLGSLFANVFGLHFSPYWYAVWISMGINGIFLYFLVRSITKNRWVSCIASVFFSLSYFGQWEMYPDYSYFLERVVVVPLLLISFWLLYRGLDEHSKTLLTGSLTVFSVSIWLTHFSVLFVPLLIIYQVVWVLRNRKLSAVPILVTLGFIAITVGISFLPGKTRVSPGSSLFAFALKPQSYAEPVLRQFAFWTQYPSIISHHALFSQDKPLQFVTFSNVQKTMPVIVALYILGFLLIWLRLPKMRVLALSVLLATAAMFAINAYFGNYNLMDPRSNRYLYYPSILLSVFWALVLMAMIPVRIRAVIALVHIGIVAMYSLINISLISNNFDEAVPAQRPVALLYKTILQNRPKQMSGTLVLLPYPLSDEYVGAFFTEQIGNGQVTYFPKNVRSSVLANSIAARHTVVELVFNPTCRCFEEIPLPK